MVTVKKSPLRRSEDVRPHLVLLEGGRSVDRDILDVFVEEGREHAKFRPLTYERQRRQRRPESSVQLVAPGELPAGVVPTETLLLELFNRGKVLSPAGLTRLKKDGVITPHEIKVRTAGRPAYAWDLDATLSALQARVAA